MQIDIFVYILENDGACLSAALNCAGLALSDAAVPMYDIMTSVSLAIIDNQIFIDPNYNEETLALANTNSDANHGTITLAWLPGIKQISEFRLVGSIDMECTTNCLEILEKECATLSPIIQKVIVSDVVRNLKQKKHLENEEKKREELLNTKAEEWKKILNTE